MAQSKLIHLEYYDQKAKVRLKGYADTIICEHTKDGKSVVTAIRFGGYPELVRGLSDAMYGGATVEATIRGETRLMQCKPKAYDRQLAHEGVYATVTMMVKDDVQITGDENSEDGEEAEIPADGDEKEKKPRTCYIFVPAGDKDRLYEELDRKTAAPLIPAYRDYVIDTLIDRGFLRKMEVLSLTEKLDAWVLDLLPEDKNVVQVLEDGLKSGAISVPGGLPGTQDGFEEVRGVTDYLNAFGVTVAERIRNQFQPLFDPASEPLSEEVLAINEYIEEHAGYSLYDPQLAVAEAVKRQLTHKKCAIIRAECGSGKTKIGSTALGALHGLWASQHQDKMSGKSFGLVMCPSHITKKWVREIAETLPNTYGMVVKSITDLNRLYSLYEAGDKSVYAVFSKERARDGYMRYPAVRWNKRLKAFLCPDCRMPIQADYSQDGSKYKVNADQFFFLNENKKNHKCPECGTPLWAPINGDRKLPWVKIGDYGWVYRGMAKAHLDRTKVEKVWNQINVIAEHPDGCFPTRGACRRFPLSTYIKKKLRGRVDGFLCDELHEYNNASGQGDAMAELFGVSKHVVGMTATLINGYSSGIFHLLYRMVPGLMRKDRKRYAKPNDFDSEYGVIETVYELADPSYNSNRRSTKSEAKTRQLPGVSPLVFSRFLLEYTAFLSLSDMGKELPDYEEIPVPVRMPPDVRDAYKEAEAELTRILRQDRKIANRILSAYMNLLTVYPDQPYDQPDIIHPMDGYPLVSPQNVARFEDVLPKEEKTMEIVRAKIAAGEKVLIYTSWTRTDSQRKLLKLLREAGIKADVLLPKIPPDKREEWVDKRLASGLQVLITNPRCVETGLDLNAFTVLIFYSMGYNLFTFRQASRRSWRINQTAPRVEVYMLYYENTMQAKAMKLMGSKLAVASLIEGNFFDEGLAAMGDEKDLTSQMAKELTLGIKDNVEDIAASFKKMAFVNPDRKPRRRLVPKRETEIIDLEPVVTDTGIQHTQRRQMQEMYDGLLAKSREQKRNKKRAEIENQISLFDTAA